LEKTASLPIGLKNNKKYQCTADKKIVILQGISLSWNISQGLPVFLPQNWPSLTI
jgi:hypothetical protein